MPFKLMNIARSINIAKILQMKYYFCIRFCGDMLTWSWNSDEEDARQRRSVYEGVVWRYLRTATRLRVLTMVIMFYIMSPSLTPPLYLTHFISFPSLQSPLTITYISHSAYTLGYPIENAIDIGQPVKVCFLGITRNDGTRCSAVTNEPWSI